MGTIICLAHAAGRRHDFRLLKESGVRLHPATHAVTDTGYLGLQTRHGNSTMPKKRSNKNPLPVDDKRHNRAIQRPHPRRERHGRCETLQDRLRPIPKPQKALWPALYAHCCDVQQGLVTMKLCKRSLVSPLNHTVGDDSGRCAGPPDRVAKSAGQARTVPLSTTGWGGDR